MDGIGRKRVSKACDRCRLKKSKCDGSSPCLRCKSDNSICFFGERKKLYKTMYSKEYVEMLEKQQTQLVSGLQELYARIQNGQGWAGAPLEEMSSGKPLTHDILERLGALKPDTPTTNEKFEEDLPALQQRLISSASDFMQQAPSPESDSEADQSLVYEQLGRGILFFAQPCDTNCVTPILPNESLCSHSIGTFLSEEDQPFRTSGLGQSNMDYVLMQYQTWDSAAVRFNDSMECITSYENLDYNNEV